MVPASIAVAATDPPRIARFPAPGRRVAAAAWLVAAAACATGTADTDNSREGAGPIRTCGVVTDKVDAEGGDEVDFKLLQVPERGVLSVTIHWDRPDVAGQFSLQDKFGVILERKTRNPSTNNDNINRPVEPGIYFIHIDIEAGQSVYSVETSFAGATGGGCGDTEEPIPVIVELQRKVEDAKKSGPKDGGRGGSAPAAGPAFAAPPPAAAMAPPMGVQQGGPGGFGGGGQGGAGFARAPLIEGSGGGGSGAQFPEPAGPKVSRGGAVIRYADAPGGGTLLTIDLGRADGVRKGVRGALVGPGGRPVRGASLVVVKVFDSACRAKTSYPSDQINDGANAVLNTLR